MNLQKVLLILISPLLIELVVACCDCWETTYLSYTNCSLQIEPIDNSGPTVAIANSSSVGKEAFGLRIHVRGSENICARKPSTLFMSSASAFSCDCPPAFLYQPEDSIVSIGIQTVFDFDAEHSSGSDISDYFQVFSLTEFFTIAQFLSTIESTKYDSNTLDLEVDLLLITPPAIREEHQFIIRIELSDGRTLEEQSDIVRLL